MDYRRRTTDKRVDELVPGGDPATWLDHARRALADGRAADGLLLAEVAREQLVATDADDVARADFVVGVALGQQAAAPTDAVDAVALLDGAATWFARRDDHWNEAMALFNAGIVAGAWAVGDDVIFPPGDPLDRLRRAAAAVEQLDAGDDDVADLVRAVAAAGVRIAGELDAAEWVSWFRALAPMSPDPDETVAAPTGPTPAPGGGATVAPPAEGFDAVRQALAAGNRDAALREMRGEVARSGALVPLDVLAGVGDAFGAGRLADICRRHVGTPALDRDALFEVGYQLVEVGLHAIAVPFLQEVLRVAPGDMHATTELVVALEATGRHREVVELLEADPALVAQDFLIGYLLVFNSVMAGDLPRAGRHLDRLPRPTAGPDEQPTVMYERLVAMVRRGQVVAPLSRLDHTDLRGWHFVITGGVLTATSPYGKDDGMYGRFAFVGDSYANVRLGLDRLRAVLSAWGVSPPVVLALPDRSSQAVGIAAGQVLGIPVRTWSPGSEAGLVVAYDLDGTGVDLQSLAQNQPGQVLYAHAASWTSPPPVAPDIVTFLHQVVTQPWAQHMRVREGADGKMVLEDVPADESDPATLAQLVVAADPATAHLASNEATITAFARAVATEAAGTSAGGLREPFWEGGPVASARFM